MRSSDSRRMRIDARIDRPSGDELAPVGRTPVTGRSWSCQVASSDRRMASPDTSSPRFATIVGQPKLAVTTTLAGDGMKRERKHPAGERFARAAELFVEAAAFVGRQEAAGAVGARANAMVAAPARHRLERVAVGPFGRRRLFRETSARRRGVT